MGSPHRLLPSPVPLREPPPVRDDIPDRAAPQGAPDRGNTAVGAAVVAAVGDFKIGVMRGRQLNARRFMRVDPAGAGLFPSPRRREFPAFEKLPRDTPRIGDFVDPQPRIHPRKFRKLRLFRPFDETASDNYASFFRRAHLPSPDGADRFRRLGPRLFEKRAGIDELNLRIGIRIGQPEPLAEKRSRGDLGIDKILRAAKTGRLDHRAHIHGRIRRIFFLSALNCSLPYWHIADSTRNLHPESVFRKRKLRKSWKTRPRRPGKSYGSLAASSSALSRG